MTEHATIVLVWLTIGLAIGYVVGVAQTLYRLQKQAAVLQEKTYRELHECHDMLQRTTKGIKDDETDETE